MGLEIGLLLSVSRAKIRFERERNGPIESATALDPVPSQAKITFITSAFMVHQMAIAALNHPVSPSD